MNSANIVSALVMALPTALGVLALVAGFLHLITGVLEMFAKSKSKTQLEK